MWVGQLQPVTLHSSSFYHVCMWHNNMISIYFPAGDLFISFCTSTQNRMPYIHFSPQRNNSFQPFFDISTYDCQSTLYGCEKAYSNTFNLFQRNLCKPNDKWTLSVWRFCGDCNNNYSLFSCNTGVLVYPLAVLFRGKLFVNRRIYSTDHMSEISFGFFSRYFLIVDLLVVA
jgi:hypothetical protein